MKETSCDVIRDLLPLYEDEAVSEETAELVREHLKGCPGCREELRKMRTPISLPPDGDKEAMGRYLARQARLRRRKKIRRACIRVPLAALAVFCLCYTLIPRSWSSVGCGTGPDRVVGHHVKVNFSTGMPEFDVWMLTQRAGEDAAVTDAFLEALRAGSYRAKLRNLANHTPLAPLFQDSGVEGSDGSIALHLVKDDAFAVSVMLYDTPDHEVHIQRAGDPNTYFYYTDGKAYDAIAALIQEYGEFQK